MIDFVPRHFLLVNDTVRLYDLGLYYHGHPPCGPQSNNSMGYWQNSNTVKRPDQCMFELKCVQGMCVGLHYQINYHVIRNKLLVPLLGLEFYNIIPLTNGVLTSSGIIGRIDQALKGEILT